VEYKFRGVSAVSGKMVFGSYASSYHAGTGHIIIAADGFGHHEVTIETVGQLTGRDDKNCNSIYAGDIVKDDESSYMQVVWSTRQLCWTIDGEMLGDYDSCDLEIIGNIHQHSHLLEQNKCKQ